MSGTTVKLDATGSIGQTGGILIASTLTGKSTGGTTLSDNNQVTSLGLFTNTGAGGFSLTDIHTLTVTGTVSSGGGTLTLTPPSLTVSGPVNARGCAVMLTANAGGAAGTIPEQTGGPITGRPATLDAQ